MATEMVHPHDSLRNNLLVQGFIHLYRSLMGHKSSSNISVLFEQKKELCWCGAPLGSNCGCGAPKNNGKFDPTVFDRMEKIWGDQVERVIKGDADLFG